MNDPGGRDPFRIDGAGPFLKELVLFLASPAIGLAYMSLFPFIGAAELWRTLRHARQHHAAAG